MRLPVLPLHQEIDRAAAELARLHASRLQCREGCADCCVDEITVWRVEADRIRAAAQALLQTEAPHPEGRCAFLDAQLSCRIYADRPYVCRTQGLPLRWTDVDEAGNGVEYRDICPLNDAGDPPLEALEPTACWTLGPVEERLSILEQARHGEPERVSLRSLFER